MRILCFGGNTYHPALRELGHDVRTIVDPGKAVHPGDCEFSFFTAMADAEPFILSQVSAFRPDLIIQGDNSTPLIHAGLENLDIPRFWVSVDTHIHKWHRHYAAVFDRVFFAHHNFREEISACQPDTLWLPCCFHGTPIFTPWETRTHEISFVGKLDPAVNPARVDFFRELDRLGIKIDIRSGDYVPVYASSKMVINQSANRDLNLRFFEAPGCGALLLTDDIGFSGFDLLTPGKDFLVYKNAEDLRNKIAWVRDNPAIAEKMARNAYFKISRDHRPGNRARQLMDTFTLPHPAAGPSSAWKKAHLAFAAQLCTQLNYPEPLIAWFLELARRQAEAAAEEPESRAWALLVLAMNALDRGKTKGALGIIDTIEQLPPDPSFQYQFYRYKTLLLFQNGRLSEGNVCLDRALEFFPGDPDFARIAAAINHHNR